MPTGSSQVSGWSTVPTSSSVPPHPPQPPMQLHKEYLTVYCTAHIWWQQVHFTWRSWLVFTVSLLTNSTLNAISMSWQPTSSPCSQKAPQLHKIWTYMMSVFTAKIQPIGIHEACITVGVLLSQRGNFHPGWLHLLNVYQVHLPTWSWRKVKPGKIKSSSKLALWQSQHCNQGPHGALGLVRNNTNGIPSQYIWREEMPNLMPLISRLRHSCVSSMTIRFSSGNIDTTTYMRAKYQTFQRREKVQEASPAVHACMSQ